MASHRWIRVAVAVLAGGAALGVSAATRGGLSAQQQAPAGRIAIDPDDIAGTVTSARGPEAGVWVIAETTDTPTRFRKIVVTDDQGRYLLPDLPVKATFSIWTRGYGLVELTRDTCNITFRGVQSARVETSPMRDLAKFVVEAGEPGLKRA